MISYAIINYNPNFNQDGKGSFTESADAELMDKIS